MISSVTRCIDMVELPPDSTGKKKITAGDIGAPTDFRHFLHIAPHSSLPAPNDIGDLFQVRAETTTHSPVQILPESSVRLPGGEVVPPRHTLRTRILGDREPLPFLGEFQARQAKAGSVLPPPPPPKRIGSLAAAPSRELPPAMVPPIPDRATKPRAAMRPPQQKPDSMPAAARAEEFRGASRVHDKTAGIERGEQPLMDALEHTPFI